MALIAGGLLYSRRKQDVPVPEGNRIQLVSSQDDVSDFDAIVSHLQREKGGITLQEILAMDDQKRELENRRHFRLPQVKEEDMPVVVPGLEGREEGSNNVLLSEMTRSSETEETTGIVLMNPPAERDEAAPQLAESREANPLVSIVVHSTSETVGEPDTPKETVTETEKPAETVREEGMPIAQGETQVQEVEQRVQPKKKEKKKREKKKGRFASAKENIVSTDIAIPNNESL